MSLADIADVSISSVDPGVSQVGFGTPAIFGYHTHWTNELVREYSSLTGMASDGFALTDGDGIYRAAAAFFSQNPKVKTVKVIRRTTGSTQRMKLVPTAVNSFVYSFDVVKPDGTVVTATYTADGTATVAEITAGLRTAVNALSGSILTATDQTTYLQIDAAAANTFYGFQNFSGNMTIEDVTPSASISTQLDAAVLEDPDWYFLMSTSKGNPEIVDLAIWTEANTRIFGYSTCQSAARDATTSNIGATLKASAYARTFGRWSSKPYLHPEASWAGRLLPYDPGSETWAFKTLAGDAVDVFTETQIGNMKTNKLNYYFALAGKNIVLNGITAAGEYIDLVRFRDWFCQRGREGIFGRLAAELKVSFDDVGIGQVENEIWNVIRAGIAVGAIAAFPKPTVISPKATDVSASDKSARHLPGITYAFNYSSAIHSVSASGTLRQ